MSSPATSGSGVPPRKRRRRGRSSRGLQSNGMEIDTSIAKSEKKEDEVKTAQKHSGARTSKTTLAYLTATPFSSLAGVVSEATLRAIDEKMGYTAMTKVQADTLPLCCQGKDLVGKAKTGTGKTLSFMIPCIEKVAKVNNTSSSSSPAKLTALVISPTRELAYQTLEEGRLIASFHEDISIACVVGGTPIKKDHAPVKRCQILVATPGRLNDHIQNTAGFAQRLHDIQLLVFDECDQLLDGGFKQAIDTILAALISTKSTRQTLLFSATLPTDVSRVAQNAMRPGYTIADCVGKEDDPTHADIPQTVLVAQDDLDLCSELTVRISQAVEQKNHKIIVFFQTARMTQLYFELFSLLQKQDIQSSPIAASLQSTKMLEMHSRKSQTHRDRVAKIFRETEHGVIMFTSDVSARGMDYPSISFVIQFGAPTDSAQYVHRLGRTGRGDGVRGVGILLLAHFESYFLNQLRQLPITTTKCSLDDDKIGASEAMRLAAAGLPPETITQAYQAWLGFYNSSLRKLGWSKDELVANANAWVRSICQAPETPGLQAKTIGKMGLKGTRGLVIDRSFSSSGGRGRAAPPKSQSAADVQSQQSHSADSYAARGRGRGGSRGNKR